MVKDVWWDNVIFREFAAHFISMSDEQVVRDIRESVVKVINLDESGDSFGANMVRRAKERLCGRRDVADQNGTKGGRPRKETTADGDTREDSQDRKSGTSANIYGEAPHREAGDVSATFSKNMRRVPQNEAPAHGFSGGRTAQGTMSRSPEAAAQSGKDYDQETDQVSTDEARQSQRRAGADSVRGTPLHSAPARSPARKFRNKEEYMQWAIDSGLDATDASECWDATLERGGKDKDGNVVKNIKAFAVKWCETRASNREEA